MRTRLCFWRTSVPLIISPKGDVKNWRTHKIVNQFSKWRTLILKWRSISPYMWMLCVDTDSPFSKLFSTLSILSIKTNSPYCEPFSIMRKLIHNLVFSKWRIILEIKILYLHYVFFKWRIILKYTNYSQNGE